MKPIHEMTIAIASDHAGYVLKQTIIQYLEQNGATVTDCGCPNQDSCDYPDYAHPLANRVEQGLADYGIAICGTGNGISMTVNKHQGIRAALCWDKELAQLARQHNNANILSLPARFIDTTKALEMVHVFLTTDFEGGRHERRIHKIPCA